MNNETNKTEEVFNEMPEKKAGFVASHKKAIIITALSILLVGCILFATVAYIVPAVKYGNALDDIENGNYKDAYITLKTLGNYKDSEKILRDFTHVYLNEESRYYDEYADLIRTETIKLNELGEKRLEVRYDEEGELLYKEEYDENGNEICFIGYENYKGERRLYSKHEYNENGDITLVYHSQLSGIYKHVYEYDAYGQLIRSTEYIKEHNTEETYKYQYEYKFSNGRLYSVLANGKELYAYDDEGRLKSASTLRGDTIKSKTEYAYDENGNKTLEIKYGLGGVIGSKTAWENGEKTLEEIYKDGIIEERKIYKNGKNVLAETYTDGELRDKEVWEYDASGKTMLYESYRTVSGGLMLRKKREYNEYGKIKQTLRYDDNGDYYVERMYTYDENGNETQRVDYDQNGEPSGRVEYTYNGNGDLLSETRYNKNGKVVSKTEREYDFDGNTILIKSYKLSVYSENGKKVTKVNKEKRVLEYDGKGRITLWADYHIDENGEEILSKKEINEYDKYGNTILKTECIYYKEFGDQYGEKTTETEYVLEYDEDGFVISETKLINGVLRSEKKYTDPIVLYKPKK